MGQIRVKTELFFRSQLAYFQYFDRTSLKRKILLRSAVLLREAVLELRFSVRRLTQVQV